MVVGVEKSRQRVTEKANRKMNDQTSYQRRRRKRIVGVPKCTISVNASYLIVTSSVQLVYNTADSISSSSRIST
jgi:hypothetical protein